MTTHHLPAKALGAVLVVMVVTGGAAAAATGALSGSSGTPMPLTTAGATAVPHDSSPGPSGHAPNAHSDAAVDSAPPTAGASTTGNGPSPNADFGLCTAEANNGGHPGRSDVFPSPSVCTAVTHPGAPVDTAAHPVNGGAGASTRHGH